ncbi:MAG TPA: S1/P1 nuclease [Chitinophagaceae bacterium]|nr:S1/P1 nuclease [Chitinophagaceae bacterium]
MKKLRPLLLTIGFVIVSISSFAWWGQNGHRIVGEIANSYLSNKARKAIREILGNESIAITSNWADFIKSDSSFNYLSPWHYINVKQGLSQSDFNIVLQNDTVIDAYTRLNFLITELKNQQLLPEKKQMYLRLLIHIAGDIHQPLHVGRLEDLGGNRIRVLWFGDSTNLHSVWDEKLIESQNLSYSEYVKAINHSTKEQRKQWQEQPMNEWFFESYQLAGKIYSGITQPHQRLSFRYNFDYIDILNSQLLKGGVRLAGLLNSIFG